MWQRETRRSVEPGRRLNLSRFGHGPLSLKPSAFCVQLISMNRLQILHFVYCLKLYQSSYTLNQRDGHQNLNFKCLD